MKNYAKSGDLLTLTAPTGGVTSGLTYKIGVAIVIATATVAAGQPFVGKTTGEIDIPAATAQAWTEGALVYWDDVAKVYTTTAATNQKAGYATVAKLTAAAAGRVRLVPTI